MNVLFVTPWYPNPGKSINHGVFVRDQAVEISRDHSVTVISSEVNYDSFHIFSYTLKKSTFGRIEEHRLIFKRSLPFLNQLNYLLVTLGYALKIAQGFKPDIVHGNISYPSAFWCLILKWIIRKPFVITEHFSQFAANFRSDFHKVITLFSLRRADKIIAVSNHTAGEVERYLGRRPIVIGNVIDFKKFIITRQHPRKQPSVFNIGFLGVLENHKKGLETLLKALAGIRYDFMLHIAGGGVFVEYYQDLARSLGILDKCRFYGFTSHWEVPALMSKLDFFVSASKFESFGMAIVEAMACGLPVVATDSGGPRDFITEFNGVLVPKENSEFLRAGIEELILRYPYYDPVVIRKFAQDNFSGDIFLGRINQVYQSVLGED